MSKNWAAEQAKTIGAEVRRLRGKRPGQWLSDRTAELGYRISRTTISEMESGRRKHFTTAELTVLARALDTSPTALMCPGPYDGMVEVLPGVEVTKIRSAQWVSGLLSEPTDVHILVDSRGEYTRNHKRLRLAREVWDLEESGVALRAQMMKADQSDDEKSQLIDTLLEVQRRLNDRKAEMKADDAR